MLRSFDDLAARRHMNYTALGSGSLLTGFLRLTRFSDLHIGCCWPAFVLIMAIAAQRSATFHVREFRRLRIHTLTDADSGRARSRCGHVGTNGLEFGRLLVLDVVLSGTGDRQ